MQKDIGEKFWNEIKEKSGNNCPTLIIQFFSDSEVTGDFLKQVGYLTKGLGGGGQYIHCTFPCQLDEYEVFHHGFDGICFSFFEEEVAVDVPTFRKYLRLACEAYWKVYPESRHQLEEYLARPQPPLEEGALPLWKEMRDAGKFPKPYSEFE